MKEQAKQDFDAIEQMVLAGTRALTCGDLSPKTEYLVEELLGQLCSHRRLLKAMMEAESQR